MLAQLADEVVVALVVALERDERRDRLAAVLVGLADDLPKTRSGKIMRRLLRDIAEGNELGDVTTLREPGVMQDLEEKVKSGADDGNGDGKKDEE